MLAQIKGYYPPELSEGLYSPKSDMYSYGVVGILYYSSDNSNYLCTLRLFWRPTVAKELMSPAVKIIDWYVFGFYVQMQYFITVEYLRVTIFCGYQCLIFLQIGTKRKLLYLLTLVICTIQH